MRGATVALTVLLAAVVWSMSRLAGGAMVLFLLVLATRALGQSALSVASITAVGKSFDRRVGVAMGVYSVLLSVFFAAAFVGGRDVGPRQRLARGLGAGRATGCCSSPRRSCSCCASGALARPPIRPARSGE